MTTGDVLISRWEAREKHPLTDTCPKCGADLLREAISRLAYVFTSCTCNKVPYAHFIEQLWHTSCLIEGAPLVVESTLLADAAYALDRYTRGRPVAARIRSFLGLVTP